MGIFFFVVASFKKVRLIFERVRGVNIGHGSEDAREREPGRIRWWEFIET